MDVLPCRAGIDATQRFAGRIGRPGTRLLFEKTHEFPAPQRTSRDEMLWKDPLGVGLPRPAQGPTEDRDDTDVQPHAVAPGGPASRVGVELNLVILPAQRTAPTGHGYYDEGDKVLKCFDGKGTLPCSVWGARAFQSPAKESKHPRPLPSGPALTQKRGNSPGDRCYAILASWGRKRKKRRARNNKRHHHTSLDFHS